MDRGAIKSFYAQSLLWIALFLALAQGIELIVELLSIDFIHGNPNRPQSNAVFMMIAYPPIMGIISTVGVFLVFTLPQATQAVATYVLMPRFGRFSYVIILLMVPVTAIITWYCYDYFTPSNVGLVINDYPGWTPYQHGITLHRYLVTLAVQAPVTIFSLLYCDAATRRASTRWIILGAIMLAIVAGGIWGHRSALNQFRFIDHPGLG